MWMTGSDGDQAPLDGRGVGNQRAGIGDGPFKLADADFGRFGGLAGDVEGEAGSLFGKAAPIDAIEKRPADPDGARPGGIGYVFVPQKTKDEVAGLVVGGEAVDFRAGGLGAGFESIKEWRHRYPHVLTLSPAESSTGIHKPSETPPHPRG